VIYQHSLIGYNDGAHLERGPRRERLMRRTLPYGMWTGKSGRKVLFNRGYRPIWQRSGDMTQPADRDEWVSDIAKQEWFFHDGIRRGGARPLLGDALASLRTFRPHWRRSKRRRS
jgi:hypothetical protein